MIDAAALAALNHLLKGANWARGRLAPFAGRHARFVMPPVSLAFVVTPDGHLDASAASEASDVVIHLPADTPFQLLHGLDKAMAGARVEGNAEFATELSFVLRHLRWDAEEDLARIVGDVPARRIVQGTNEFIGWQRQAARNLGENVAEYLTHESSLLLTRQEFSEYGASVAALDAALDELELRSARLG